MKAHHARVANYIPFSWVDGPGNRFVLFLQGCNFNCLACHNPQTIPLNTPRATEMTIDEVLGLIRKSMPYISGITVSGGEATVQHDFIFDLFSAMNNDSDFEQLTRFVDTNGNASSDVWERLAPVTDGFMVDLKALDDEVHTELTGSSNAVVLEAIRTLESLGALYEVRLLLVPGWNDSDETLQATARWLREINPAIRVKINAFNSHGVRAEARTWPVASKEDLDRYALIFNGAPATNPTTPITTAKPAGTASAVFQLSVES